MDGRDEDVAGDADSVSELSAVGNATEKKWSLLMTSDPATFVPEMMARCLIFKQLLP